MTQEGIVTRLFPHDMAEVAVTRMTACGGNCGSCESCMLQSEVKAIAKNHVSAEPGQRVLIESRTSPVFGAVFLVYVMPLVCFLLGYGAAYAAGLAAGIYDPSVFDRMGRREYTPAMAEPEREKRYQGWQDAVRMICK